MRGGDVALPKWLGGGLVTITTIIIMIQKLVINSLKLSAVDSDQDDLGAFSTTINESLEMLKEI